MDRLELRLEALAPERRDDECRQATDAGWIDPDEVVHQPRWVLLLGVEPDAETPD
jgi:hypothetical protein